MLSISWINRLQTGVVLSRKRWKGEVKCPLCGVPEMVDHIFFGWIVSKFVWTCFKEALGWDKILSSLQGVYREWILIGCENYNFKIFSFSITWWALWIARNKMRVEKKILTTSWWCYTLYTLSHADGVCCGLSSISIRIAGEGRVSPQRRRLHVAE